MAYEVRKIAIDSVNIGDVAAEMHCHQTNFGTFKGWMVTDTFEISESMYKAMHRAMPERVNEGPVIPNKYARIVSINENYSDFTVRSVLVIYIYDFQYYFATLAMPS